MNHSPLKIEYFSDILCIWAWIAERRIQELNNHFKDQILIRYQYIDLFGDTETRIQTQWKDKGLHHGFGSHVIASAAPYDSATVNPDVWSRSRPTTSANAHMLIKAVELVSDRESAIQFANTLRKSFFVHANDISDLGTLFTLIKQQKIDTQQVKKTLDNGTALAALMSDYQKAHELGIKGSPTFVMNNGRQNLFGNVGYKVLKANIEELLIHTSTQASWC